MESILQNNENLLFQNYPIVYLGTVRNLKRSIYIVGFKANYKTVKSGQHSMCKPLQTIIIKNVTKCVFRTCGLKSDLFPFTIKALFKARG